MSLHRLKGSFKGNNMITYVPMYYKKFKCIASKCRHNCCIGWEIDIDRETLERYKNVSGSIGKKLKNCIDESGETASFILGDGDRCPFLDGDNLCQLYRSLGEESLCQICTDHPRFYNEYSDRTELGLGLCCEEAARIIINEKESFNLVETESDGLEPLFDEEELALSAKRDNLIKAVEAEQTERLINNMLDRFLDKKITQGKIKYFLSTLEKLSDERDEMLEQLENESAFRYTENELTEKAYKNILIYFLFRHFIHLSLLYGENEALFFCAFSVCVISCAAKGDLTLTEEFARLYSSEIEYSDENTENIIHAFCTVSID